MRKAKQSGEHRSERDGFRQDAGLLERLWVIGTGGTPEPFTKVAHRWNFGSQVQQQIEKLH